MPCVIHAAEVSRCHLRRGEVVPVAHHGDPANLPDPAHHTEEPRTAAACRRSLRCREAPGNARHEQ